MKTTANEPKHFVYLKIVAALGVTTAFNKIIDPYVGYHAVGFIYLLAIALMGLWRRKGPVLLAAFLSAVLWNYLFIPPLGAFAISAPEDIMMVAAFFVNSLIIGNLTARVQSRERILKMQEKKIETILDLISHEMRTPLTAIIGSSTALTEEKIKNDPKARDELIGALLGAGERLNGVIANLIEMSRLSANEVKIRNDAFEISELTDACLDKLKMQIAPHPVHFEKHGGPLLVRGDFKLLEHALSNLILNAAAYSPSDAPIELAACPAPDGIRLEIRDFGTGIPDTYRERVFEKFFRIPGTPAGGAGLGLSIVKRIVELHGGKITASTHPQGGAVIAFNLPHHFPDTLWRKFDER